MYQYQNNGALLESPEVLLENRGLDTSDSILPPTSELPEYQLSENNIELPQTATNIRLSARRGSGGNYLSNEIFYRVGFLREKHQSSVLTGHLHVGFTRGDGN